MKEEKKFEKKGHWLEGGLKKVPVEPISQIGRLI